MTAWLSSLWSTARTIVSADWQADMLDPHMQRARWHAKAARQEVAQADARLFKGDVHMADFWVRHAAMERANAAKVLSGDYAWTGAEPMKDACPDCGRYRVLKMDDQDRWSCADCYRPEVRSDDD